MSILEKSTYFPAELTREMFNKVTGHSSLAKVSGAKPMAFCGQDVFVFDFDSEVSIVGEAAGRRCFSSSCTDPSG